MYLNSLYLIRLEGRYVRVYYYELTSPVRGIPKRFLTFNKKRFVYYIIYYIGKGNYHPPQR